MGNSNDGIDPTTVNPLALKLALQGNGGVMAALLAVRRDDVIKLITVAGNVDHEVVTDYHNINPLRGFLNLSDYIEAL